MSCLNLTLSEVLGSRQGAAERGHCQIWNLFRLRFYSLKGGPPLSPSSRSTSRPASRPHPSSTSIVSDVNTTLHAVLENPYPMEPSAGAGWPGARTDDLTDSASSQPVPVPVRTQVLQCVIVSPVPCSIPFDIRSGLAALDTPSVLAQHAHFQAEQAHYLREPLQGCVLALSVTLCSRANVVRFSSFTVRSHA